MKEGAGFVVPDTAMIGAAVASLQNQINVLKSGDTDLTAVTVTLPEPSTTGAGFAIAFRPHEKKIHKGCYGTFRTLIPSSTAINRLRTVIQPTNPVTLAGTGAIAGTTTVTGTTTAFLTDIGKGDQIIINAETRIVANVASDTSLTVTVAFGTTASAQIITAVRKRERMSDNGAEITADNQAAGAVEYEFPQLLEWNVGYGLVRLIAWDEDGAGRRLKNPPDEPDVGSYLATFTTPVNNPGTLTSLSLTITQDDSRRASVWLNLTQPAIPVALESVRIRRKDQGAADATYVIVVRKFSTWTDDFFSVGAHTIELDDTVKTKPSHLYTWECRIKAIGGTTTTFTQDTSGDDSHDVPARGLLVTHKNMIDGGAFLNNANSYGTGTAAQVGKHFFKAPSTASVRIDNVAGAGGTLVLYGVGWDDVNHRIAIANDSVAKGGKLCCRIRKQILPGETYNFNLLIKVSSLTFGKEYNCDLYDEGAGAVITGASVTQTMGLKSASWRVFWGVFVVDTAYTMNGRQWLRFYPTADGTLTTYIDNLCLNRGEKLKLWEPGDGEGALDSDVAVAVDTGVGVVGGASSGFYSSSGIQFGVAISTGGVIVLNTAP